MESSQETVQYAQELGKKVWPGEKGCGGNGGRPGREGASVARREGVVAWEMGVARREGVRLKNGCGWASWEGGGAGQVWRE